MMMLVQPADAVQAPASPFSLAALLPKAGSGSHTTFFATLVPSWLALLAAVVLLSSARAALLYVHGRRSRKGKGPAGVVLVQQPEEKQKDEGKEKKQNEDADKAVPTPLSRPPSPPTSAASPVSVSAPSVTSSPSSAPPPPAAAAQRTSWFWGLVSWNRSSLPTLPLQVQRSARDMDFQDMSRRNRAIMMNRRAQDIEQQQQMMQLQRGLRSPPAFGPSRFPSPSSSSSSPSSLPYHTTIPSAPASMAKMIMSRHTFRRPAARPPPVRSARVVQYSRKYVPPPSPSPSESDEEEELELEELEEGTSSKKEEVQEKVEEKETV